MAADQGSTAPRRTLGRALKGYRLKASMTVEAAYKAMWWSKNKLYRVERGETPVRPQDVLALAKLYGIPEDQLGPLIELAEQSKAKGWWHSYSKAVPAWFEMYVAMEAATRRIRQYEPGLIPGLVQTAEYAEAMLRMRKDSPEDQIAKGVAMRMARQAQVLHRKPGTTEVSVIIDEAVLRRPIADGEAMQRQLAHLVNGFYRQSLGVNVRVLPSRVGPHRGHGAGGFVILEFPSVDDREPEPTTVYCEGLTGALYLDKREEVETYSDVWQELDGLALSPAASAEFISTIITRESIDA